jgi:cytochrome c-type biogenesis protein CcmE
MKKSHIFGIVVIAIAIAVIMSTAGDASSYVNFKEASQLAADGKENKVHVVGTLKKDAVGQIVGMEYQPQVDPNYFAFTLVDQNKEERKVVYTKSKPQDFERSEQVVVVGSIENDTFVADQILMKCPSKYQDNKLRTPDGKQAQL